MTFGHFVHSSVCLFFCSSEARVWETIKPEEINNNSVIAPTLYLFSIAFLFFRSKVVISEGLALPTFPDANSLDSTVRRSKGKLKEKKRNKKRKSSASYVKFYYFPIFRYYFFAFYF